ncbi:MAG: hypothetical protein LBT71_03855 [Azoarcus sp.]|nr:hypothetical protein [Azoarcus sp.]
MRAVLFVAGGRDVTTITFGKFRVVAHASAATDGMRRIGPGAGPALKEMRRKPLEDRDARTELDAFVARPPLCAPRGPDATKIREIPDREQIHVVRAMLRQWAIPALEGRTDEGRGRDDPQAPRRHRHPDPRSPGQRGFPEAIDGLFQAAKRKACADADLPPCRRFPARR